LSHSHDHNTHAASNRALAITLGLVASFFFVQLGVALYTGSLALLSDAGHMATDALALTLALTAATLASRGSVTDTSTFGWYRLEVLAALVNAVLLLGVAAYVAIESINRWNDEVTLDPLLIGIVGGIGLLVNIVGIVLLRDKAKTSMNIRGAYLEVVADAAGSVGILLGAVVIAVTEWYRIDAVVGVAIACFMAPRAVRLGNDALHVLLQRAPSHIDVAQLTRQLTGIPGVVDVHDVHVWTLTSGMEVATAHLVVEDVASTHQVLDVARDMLRSDYELEHATLQVEPADHVDCGESGW